MFLDCLDLAFLLKAEILDRGGKVLKSRVQCLAASVLECVAGGLDAVFCLSVFYSSIAKTMKKKVKC